MTYLQKCLMEHPEFDKSTIVEIYCPKELGYSDDEAEYGCPNGNSLTCEQCWNREIPGTEAMADEEAAKQSVLKTCPFCGGEAELVKDVHCAGHGEYVETTYVHCKDCGAKGPLFSDYDDDRANMTPNAIKGWNRRE